MFADLEGVTSGDKYKAQHQEHRVTNVSLFTVRSPSDTYSIQ
jgi:hypothetical protein